MVGTCQARALAECLAVMHPRCAVERHDSLLAPDRGEGDVVFQQRGRANGWTLAQIPADRIVYPRIWFNAFHPDVVYVNGPNGSVEQPMGEYHSSLIVYAWHRRLTVAQTLRLFAEPVFERLGFFDSWRLAQRTLFDEGRTVGFPLERMFSAWERSGAFMRTPNHPRLNVIADLARELSARAQLTIEVDAPDYYAADPTVREAVWPIYPEVAERLGLRGSYAFKPAHAPGAPQPPLIELDELIERTFEAYAFMPDGSLAARRLEHPAYRDIETWVAGERPGSRNGAPVAAARATNPYSDLPDERFWRRAVERLAPREVDPVGPPRFTIDRRTRIATAGSCFAQSMSSLLVRHGFNYVVAEPAPHGISADAARAAGYGVFSTRCGNIYTARQLLQLFERAYGTFTPGEDAWLRPDGRYADPFRPQIEPDGFARPDDVLADRETHLAAVRASFERLDVFVFTLGLTEAWRSRADGAVFPLAPGVVAGTMDPARYEFVNFGADEVRDDLLRFTERLRAVNPRARTVITVSPQPPIATYEPRHVLVSATYTKAALRIAADEVERADETVWYFPAFELVAAPFNRGMYYESDLRSVTPAGIEHVMQLFLAHAAGETLLDAPLDPAFLAENEAAMDVVCDEEAILEPADSRPARVAAPHADPWDEFEQFLRFEQPHQSVGNDHWLEPVVPMEPLARDAMRAPLRLEVPRSMRARSLAIVPCLVRNDGESPLSSAPPSPLFLSYRWYDEDGAPAEVGAAEHTAFDDVLRPGESVTLPMRIAAPRRAGTFRIRISLVQSEVAWFDDVDPRNGVESVVEIVSRVRAEPSDQTTRTRAIS